MAAKLFVLAVLVSVLSALTINDSTANVEIPDKISIDAITAKDTEDLFQEALKEELPGLQSMKLAQDMKFLAGEQQKQGSISSSAPQPTDAVSEFEKDVTELVLGLSKSGNGATPFGGSVDKIKKLIEQDMLPKIMPAHQRDQGELNKLKAELDACGQAKDTSISLALKQKATYEKQSAEHKPCRIAEADLYTQRSIARNDAKAKQKLMNIECSAFATLSKKLGEQNNNKDIVSKGTNENTESYIRRITETFCGKGGDGTYGIGKDEKGGGGKGGFLDQYLIAKEKCNRAMQAHKTAEAKVVELNKDALAQKMKCDNIQDVMDGAACKHGIGTKDACAAYSQCFKEKKSTLIAFRAQVKENEYDRKGEWRGLHRMLCIIGAFTDGKVEDEEIITCKNKNHTTENLTIAYPDIQKEPDACEITKLYPSTPEYKAAEFLPLPVLAKGKIDEHQCVGMENQPTLTPKAGSPSGCVCKKVEITKGFTYSADMLLKCTNCLSVKKSMDKNSCPTGTKIFSPASRSDWKAFIASASPLRDPNWIVDITRPQNGCGGCTKYAMMKGEVAQATWKTADGTPWWLRSTTYEQPNGDYGANCYMDLWKADVPTHEDSITFDDGSCSYHSKSYYCQTAKMTTSTTTTVQAITTKRCSGDSGYGGNGVQSDVLYLYASQGRWPSNSFCNVNPSGTKEKLLDYTISVEMNNLNGWRGVNSGHLGIGWNAKDMDNYDFVYFRPHSDGSCYQTGQLVNGVLKWSQAKSSSCRGGGVRGKTWFKVKVIVTANGAEIVKDGYTVASIPNYFTQYAAGTMIVANGYKNNAMFRNFKLEVQERAPGKWVKGAAGKTCDQVCSGRGEKCDSAKQSTITSAALVVDAFKQAGYTCRGHHKNWHRSFAGTPFSTGRADDCYYMTPGGKSTCTSNAYGHHSALCFCTKAITIIVSGYGTQILKNPVTCNSGTLVATQSGPHSTNSNCEAYDQCVIEVDSTCRARVWLRDRCASVRSRYGWSAFTTTSAKSGSCAMTVKALSQR